jgi:hypothetical protein
MSFQTNRRVSMDKSVLRLALSEETIKRFYEEDPEFKIALDSAALKWVQDSVIKPRLDDAINEALRKVKRQTDEHVQKALTITGISGVTTTMKYDTGKTLNENIKTFAKAIIRDSFKEAMMESTMELYDEIKAVKEEQLKLFEATTLRLLNPEQINRVIRAQVDGQLSSIVNKVLDAAKTS